jgi:hypothetical protein
LGSQDLVQNASSSEMIKTVHGSLAKPFIVLIDYEDLVMWTRYLVPTEVPGFVVLIQRCLWLCCLCLCPGLCLYCEIQCRGFCSEVDIGNVPHKIFEDITLEGTVTGCECMDCSDAEIFVLRIGSGYAQKYEY